MNTEQMIDTLKHAGVKAGQASKHNDWSAVRHWKRTLDQLEPLLKAAGLNAHDIYNEAYKQGTGFYPDYKENN